MFKSITKAVFGDPNERELDRHRAVVKQINELEPTIHALSDDQLRAKTEEFRKRLKDGATLDDLLPEAFAVVREAAVRTIGQRHYDVQLIGGMVLHQGKIAEMKTGEGKTLVATLPLYLNALAGQGVHLVTPNDYLSKFGLQQMGPIYHFLGLTAAVIQSRGAVGAAHSFRFNPDTFSPDARFQYLDPIERKEAYLADITYGTNNEFGFDYLRDNMVHSPGQLSQRGHHFAIVDEVDNILIDEARTPLIISGQADEPSELYTLFARLVKNLTPSSPDSVEAENPDGDYVREERQRSVVLTERGVDKIERMLQAENLLEGDNLYGPANAEMIPYLDNALRAHVIYEKDRDYVVLKRQVIIVDEHTGRLMIGRRFSEGLHQAIEAKEGVRVRQENVTMATVTLQNYFRMYKKLAGMTGTAATEAVELEKIYSLEVTIIPTNVPCERLDHEDAVFVSEAGKWRAVVQDIKTRHERGQPVLVGTATVETSERLSKMLRQAKIDHQVLNAKEHEKEAKVIAQAGQPGKVTIATNMAGRGVDILLGGNPEGLALADLERRKYNLDTLSRELWDLEIEKAKKQCVEPRQRVLELGGLYVLGTERHDARRIDNQLRGRSGRQGDPGESRFYLSLEDDLMRRFGGERAKGLLRRALPEDQPIELGIVSKAIEQTQMRVEGYHADMRKRVLDYDDVVNKQRETIYDQRRKIMEAKAGDLRQQIQPWIEEQVRGVCAEHLAGYPRDWDLEELYRAVLGVYPVPDTITVDALVEQGDNADGITQILMSGVAQAYDRQNQVFGPVWIAVEKQIMLSAVDQLWQRHLTDLDMLREGIGLVGYGGRDPLVEYKRQSYEMWQTLQDEIKDKVIQVIFSVVPAERKTRRPTMNRREVRAVQAGRGPAQPLMSQMTGVPAAPETLRSGDSIYDNVGRNDPCPCGSGKKFKHCHYNEIMQQRQTTRKPR
jgi:preprotein translocase subunit SecA